MNVDIEFSFEIFVFSIKVYVGYNIYKTKTTSTKGKLPKANTKKSTKEKKSHLSSKKSDKVRTKN